METLGIAATVAQHAELPPSTGIAAPVTNEASSERSHSAAWATSTGCSKRPIIWRSRRRSKTFSSANFLAVS
jgi:hypothetical protein